MNPNNEPNAAAENDIANANQADGDNPDTDITGGTAADHEAADTVGHDNTNEDVDDDNTDNDRIYLHTLQHHQIQSLTEEQLQTLTVQNVVDDLKEFTEDSLDLLKAIHRVVKIYNFNSKHFLYMKIFAKINYMENKDKIKEKRQQARAEKAKAAGKVPKPPKLTPDNDPDRIEKFRYSEEKYINHPISSKDCTNTAMMMINTNNSEDSANWTVSEGDLYFADYLPLDKMTPRQKNDTIAIVGRSFGHSEEEESGFSHSKARIAHRILQSANICAGVILVTHVPKPERGKKVMRYTVSAAVFTHVIAMRHTPGVPEPTKVKNSKFKVVNLAQIATLPEHSGHNMEGAFLDHSRIFNSIRHHFDLIIICGCAEGFDEHEIMYENAPSWLEVPPWNFPSGDTRDIQTFNRDNFFYVPLTKEYQENLADRHTMDGHTFSFIFLEDEMT
jgi:hypothetical protein